MSKKFSKEILRGGKADGLPDWLFPKKKLDEGIRVERDEHTTSKKTAKEIAKDHMTEMGTGYYPALKKMEDRLKKQHEHSENVSATDTQILVERGMNILDDIRHMGIQLPEKIGDSFDSRCDQLDEILARLHRTVR